MWSSSLGRSLRMMSRPDDVTATPEPAQVGTELDDLAPPRRRISSASTSSFEDFEREGEKNTTERKPETTTSKSKESVTAELRGPAVIHTSEAIDEKSVKPPTTKGVVLTYKTHAFDDPTFYSQSTLPSTTSSPAAKPRVQARVAEKSSRASSVNMTSGQDRDPENVNEIVKINFEEVFAEPEGTYSFGTIWGASYRIFSDSKLWCYRFLSALCAFPCALCWGVHFACLSFCQIWYYQPSIRSCKVQLRPIAKIYGMCVNAFVEPCCDAFGHLLSSIRVKVTNE